MTSRSRSPARRSHSQGTTRNAICLWHSQGHCHRGRECWFAHASSHPHGDPELGPCKNDESGLIDNGTGSTLNFEAITVSVSVEDQDKMVEKAAAIFKRYRVLVLDGLLSSDTTNLILKSLRTLHETWSNKYDTKHVGNRGTGRYEMMDAFDTWHVTHLPGYLEALEEFTQKGGLRILRALGDYQFVGGHAHLALAKLAIAQPLHSDFIGPVQQELQPLWNAPEHVPFLDLLLTLHPLTSENAALRVIPGHPSIPTTYWQAEMNPSPKMYHEPDIFWNAGLYPLPPGCAILRDLRIWHGGTPNTSCEDRYTAVLRFYSTWSLELWQQKVYEGRGLDEEELRTKLSEETRRIVAPHIVRAHDDPVPQLVDTIGWGVPS